MSKTNQIKCPNCETIIDVQDILSHQLEDEIRQKYQKQLDSEKDLYILAQEKLKQEREAFEELKRKENELFQERLTTKVREEKILIEKKLRLQVQEEQSDQIKAIQEELNLKSEQVKELNKAKADIERLKREKDEARELAEAEAQKSLNQILTIEKDKIRRNEEERNEMRMKELEVKLEEQKRLTEEMKRKQEQGSMQLQGEVQELAIEEWLMNQFPLDTIEEIKKGARGGDCIQVVHTRSRQHCGRIYYESKRTKDFQPAWIEKFKKDMREKEADIGVLVSEAMPSNMDRMGLRDGVWVCTFEEFKGLSGVLRESLIQVSNALSSQENKGDKMHLLYDYLTSNTFRMQVEAIVEGFTSMKNALESEKRAMNRIWKEREKQIEKVIANTIDMHASIRGIAGSAIQEVKALELGPTEDENE